MKYPLLLNRLRNIGMHPQIFGQLNYENDLLNTRIYTKKQRHFEPSTLYFTPTSFMPPATIEEPFTLFCYGDPIDFSIYQNSKFNITYFGDNISEAELFNATLENVTEIQQITSGMHILSNALFSGNGLQYLVDTAAHLFQNPIYVVDLQYKYLAISSGIIPDDPFLLEEGKSGYVSDLGIKSIKEGKIDERVRNLPTAYYLFNTGIQQGMLVDAIHIQGIEVGHIMMLESEQKFREFDADFFHRFCELISIELQKDSAYATNRGIMYSYFLADILKNPDVNTTQITERLSKLGYHLQEYLYILTIPPSDRDLSHARMAIITDHLHNILPGSIYAVYEGTLVFLFSKQRYSGLSDYETERLIQFLEANQLKAGISNFFEQLSDAPRFFRQAQKAVSLGTNMKDPNFLFHYSDYYMYEMLELYRKTDSEIRFLIHPGLMQLYYYDQEKSSDLLNTLQEYLKYPGQPSRVAENLHIHKNTLLYRMGKIKEISGCQFECGSDFMHFNFSLNVMEYLNMI